MANKPDHINFEVVVTPEPGKKSIFDPNAFPRVSNLDLFIPPIDKNIEVAQKLQRNGIDVHHIGEFSISASCDKNTFESFFSPKSKKFHRPKVLRSLMIMKCSHRTRTLPGSCPL